MAFYLSFKLERGCKQGDPLTYIFVICAENLSILIIIKKNIRRIEIDEQEYLMSQYADDTTFILDGSHKSPEITSTVLGMYTAIPGLKINSLKSNVIWTGNKTVHLRFSTIQDGS